MSKDLTQSARPPALNVKRLQERKLLQAEVIGLDARLQNFTPLRDQLVASGQDANAAYRTLESRHDQIMSKLKKLAPDPVRLSGPAAPIRAQQPNRSVRSLPIAPVRFHPPLGAYFGYSGRVQIGRPTDGVNVILSPQPPARVSGSIYTADLDDVGGITFGGTLVAEDDDRPYNLDLRYFWLHNWDYFILFPAPVVSSVFTYSFGVVIRAYVSFGLNPSVLMSFLSLGETPNFVGEEIVVNTDLGWPFAVTLNTPYYANGSVYNPPWGDYIQGYSTIQRSFIVEGGQAPAIALVVGLTTAQPDNSIVSLDESDAGGPFSYVTPGSSIVPSSSVGPYAYLEPDTRGGPGIVNFHYDPLPTLVEARP